MQDATQAPARGATPRLIRLGRIEGGGDPATGDLWSRPVVERVSRELPDGVAVNAAPLLGSTPGYCSANVVSDGELDSNPPGTWEYYTIDRDGTMTPDPDDDSSFDPADCYPHLQPGQQNPTHDALFNGPTGVGCAWQHIGNFTTGTFAHVYLDVDQFQGEEALQTPYGPPYTTGTVVTPAGRNPPDQDLGLWDFGSFAAGETKEMWIYFKNGAPTAFTFQGSVVAEVYEDCGNTSDDDCDGIVNNGCGTFGYDEDCFFDDDCVGGTCEGELLVSGFGAAGQEVGQDKAGTCTPICGNALTEGSEQCDDGDQQTDDGCDPNCRFPPDCAGAIDAVGYGTVSGTTVGRLNDRAGSCSQGAGEELVYEFVAPATETVCIDTFGSAYDTQLYVQTTCGASASEVVCNDDVAGVQSQLELSATMGETYWIFVDGYHSYSSGSYQLNVTSGPCAPICGDYACEGAETCADCPVDCGVCDDCDLALPMSDYGVMNVDTAGAGANQFSSCGPSLGSDAIVAFQAPDTGTVCAYTFGTTFDTELSVRAACNNPDSELACSDDAGGTRSMVEFSTVSGSTYYLVADSPLPMSGIVKVTIQAGACPDFCTGHCGGAAEEGCYCDAACLGIGDCCPDACTTCGECNDCSPPLTAAGYGTYTGTTALNGDQQAGLCGGGDGSDVIYEFIAPTDGPVCIDTFGTTFDTQLHVQGACGASAVACNDDTAVLQSRIELSVDSGESYYVVVDGFGVSDEGNYTLHINGGLCCPPGTLDLGTSCEQIAQVAGGLYHTCAISTTNKLYCWGDNTFDQLGDGGALTNSALPVRVGTASNWTALSAGLNHTCALNNTLNEIYCWGDNLYGQTGTGNPLTTRAVPTFVGSDYTSLDLGENHSCAIKSGGDMFCWGRNSNGQLGDNSTTQKAAPSLVAGTITNWAQVSGGGIHTCGRRTTGEIYCWGSNGSGRLGDGSTTQRIVPTQVTQAPANTWQDVAAGTNHTCGVRANKLYCWGFNGNAQLGLGADMTNKTAPVQVGTDTDWEAARTGNGYTCGRRNLAGEKRLYCWGFNGSGQLGDGSLTQRTTPTQVGGAFIDWQGFSLGNDHACGLRAGGLHCWGWDGSGQLGDGISRRVPTEASGAYDTWTAYSVGKWHGCGIRGGQIYCWGDNTYGQLGNGSTGFSAFAVLVSGVFTDWQSVSAGERHTCAVRSGLVYCWGDNGSGRLGDGTTVAKNVPTPVLTEYTDWQSVSASLSHTCGVHGGRVMCWGFGGNGELGNGGTASSSVPVEVTGMETGWTMVDAGAGFTCGVRAGIARCWGFNGNGELGDGTLVNASSPTPVAGGIVDWLSVSAGAGSACGHRTSGEIRCWGFNAMGQLGDGTEISHTTPQPVAAPGTGWQSVTVGYDHACGIRAGRMYCWGSGAVGQNGSGTLDPRTVPMQVSGWWADWQDVGTAWDSVCARRNSGHLYCWGWDGYAQLGSLPAQLPRPIEGPL